MYRRLPWSKKKKSCLSPAGALIRVNSESASFNDDWMQSLQVKGRRSNMQPVMLPSKRLTQWKGGVPSQSLKETVGDRHC